jgi:outer membrane protein TolC
MELYTDILRKNRQAQRAEGFPYPYLTMDGAVGLVARDIGGLDDPGHDFWRGAVALTIPIFDGLLTRGLVQETTASIRRTEEELSGLRRQVEVEVLELLDSVDTARENLKAARLNLVRGEDLLEQMTMMYRVGKTDYLSVLVAEANRTDARRNLLQAGYEVLTLTASLKRAIGRSPLEPLASIEGLVQGKF